MMEEFYGILSFSCKEKFLNEVLKEKNISPDHIISINVEPGKVHEFGYIDPSCTVYYKGLIPSK